jgi:hypothetical protein
MGSLLPAPGCYGVRPEAMPIAIPGIAAAARDPATAMLRHEPEQQRSHAESAAARARHEAPP